MAYLKNWTDNFLQICLMGTSWVAVSINNITRASREMTSRKNINIFEFNGVNVAKHWHVAGEVFAISDCLVDTCFNYSENWRFNFGIRKSKCLIPRFCAEMFENDQTLYLGGCPIQNAESIDILGVTL